MSADQGDLFARMGRLGAPTPRTAAPPRPRSAPPAGRGTTLPGEGETETRKGTVQDVHYQAPGGDFRVLSVKVGGKVQKWAGKMPPVTKGQDVSATGRATTHAEHGDQFAVDDLTVGLPTSTEGLEHFLVGLKIPGLGPKTIRKIVERFGDTTEQALDQPLLLAQVRGVSGDLANRTSAGWKAAKAEREIVIQLQQFGATSLLANRIHEHYKRLGKNAVEVVTEDPYRLALDVDGVGFTTADQIALKMGVAADSIQRVRAGVLHALHEGTNKGHCYLPLRALCDVASEMLMVDPGRVDQAIDWLEEGERVIVEPVGEEHAVFPRRLHDAEQTVTARLLRLLAAAPDPPLPAEGEPPVRGAPALSIELADRAIAAFEKEAGITMAPAQRDAVRMAAQHKVLILTGGPGTGKSTILSALLRVTSAACLSVKLCAPTGRAAKRMNEATGRPASTIHRMLKWIPGEHAFEHNRNNPVPTNVLVVDEASMLDAPLASQLLDALPDGARVVLVGDVDQLPSVGPGAVLRDLIASEVIPTVRLTEIFRQAKGSTISIAAAAVNAGKAPVSDTVLPPAGAFYWQKHDDPKAAQEEILSMVTRRIPEKFGIPADQIQVLTPMHEGLVGTIALNQALQAALNPDPTGAHRGRMRPGDRVIVTKNNKDLDVSNGDIGRVLRVDPDDGDAALVVEIDGREVEFPHDKVNTVQLAYTISIHKSQGGGFSCVVVCMMRQHWMLLSRNLLYTAMTRGKKLVVLVADPRAVRTALSAARKDDRNTRLADRLREAVSR